MIEPLDPDRIRDGASGRCIGRRVLVFRETASTNDVVHRLAGGDEPEGTVVFAEKQSAGRGQFGRVWDSRDGIGLWFSILLRPRWPTHEIENLTPLVAVAVADSLASVTGLAIAIKPPNDIFYQGRKLAGILTEARTGSTITAVVGVGLNVNHSPGDFPPPLAQAATSLAIACGHPIDRMEIATRLLGALDSVYDPSEAPGSGIHARYRALSILSKCDKLPV